MAYVLDAPAMLVPAYGPIVTRRAAMPYGDRQRQWQLLRRGRYVELNLVWAAARMRRGLSAYARSRGARRVS